MYVKQGCDLKWEKEKRIESGRSRRLQKQKGGALPAKE